MLNCFINLIKVLFPRWNFFDHLGFQFCLEYRTNDKNPWNSVVFQETRSVLNLFFNPNGNLTLAYIDLIEHFAFDVQHSNLEEIQKLVTFKLIKSLLLLKLVESKIQSKQIQFRVIAKHSKDIVELYLSGWIDREKN